MTKDIRQTKLISASEKCVYSSCVYTYLSKMSQDSQRKIKTFSYKSCFHPKFRSYNKIINEKHKANGK